jgi:hypothetical protein
VAGFLVQPGCDSVQVLLDFGGNDIPVQGRRVAEVTFQVGGPEEPALDVEKVCDFGNGHLWIYDLRFAIYESVFMCPSGWQMGEPFSHAVREGIFFDMETDLGFWRGGWGLEQRSELLIDFPQRGVVEEQGFVNFCQALKDGGVGGEVFAHFDEGADDINAHGNRAGAVEDIGGHQGAVFGEGDRQVATATMRS